MSEWIKIYIQEKSEVHFVNVEDKYLLIINVLVLFNIKKKQWSNCVEFNSYSEPFISILNTLSYSLVDNNCTKSHRSDQPSVCVSVHVACTGKCTTFACVSVSHDNYLWLIVIYAWVAAYNESDAVVRNTCIKDVWFFH